MLIRTQDKRSLVDMTGHTITINQGKGHYAKRINLSNDFDYNNVEHSCIYYITCSDVYGALGRYTTEEKAMKVLDMIQKRYIDPIDQDVISSEYATIVYQNKVFEMPEDEEV